MGNIVLLDDLTINKIAAGEVIERPASVVKELVENSVDAGATKVDIEIQNGGISYIRITDNGKGIAPDDMEIAFERHATSKIRSAEDLSTVMSMGFRGEALASIAAIANVEMVSRKPDSDVGFKVVVEAGKILSKEECGCPTGTTITVRNLFFNTPVRYKFLKKDYTESGYVEDFVTRLSIIHPEISVKFINSGKTVLQTPGDGNLKNVLYMVYGKEVAEGVDLVDYTYEDIHITGAIGKPEIARSNRSNQLFFVNKRYVKDKTLTSAVEQAYKGLITIGKFAFSILNIEMSPSKVDVNVHPAKLEVRFEEESKIFKAVYHAIKNSLLSKELVHNTEKEEVPEETMKIPEVKSVLEVENTQNIVKQEEKAEIGGLFKRFKEKEEKIEEQNNNLIEELFKMKTITQTRENTPSVEIPTTDKVEQMTNIIVNSKQEPEENKKFEEMYEKTFGTQITKKEEVEGIDYSKIKLENGSNLSVFEEKEEYNPMPNYKLIGIAFSTYIIIEIGNELYIIDQHAAHERIMYEKVKKNFYSSKEKDSQLMLVPDVITLTHKEASIVKENVEMFEKAGFTLEEFGENTIKLTGVPNICMELNTKQLFLDILDEIDTVALTARQEKEDKFIATIACKAAVKANMALGVQEVDSLMQELLKLPNPFTCPHGRPTAIKMTKTDIEKKFSRR